VRHVALGDSYSAGGGLSGGTAPCGRAPGAYPALAAAAEGWDLVVATCNGATTADVVERDQYPGVGPQVTALAGPVDLVTISIGGNDIGFAPTMTECVIGQLPCDRLEPEVTAALAALGPRLATVLDELRARAPAARLVVVGYPHLVADPDLAGYQTCAGVTAPEARWLRAKAVDLAAVVRSAAEAAGALYVDSLAAFAGHEACTAEPWMAGLTLSGIDGSFHPNAAGHQRLADLVRQAARA
jgi:lysophospholipase L1-like esterase